MYESTEPGINWLQPAPEKYDATNAPVPLRPLYEGLAPDLDADCGMLLPFAIGRTTNQLDSLVAAGDAVRLADCTGSGSELRNLI